MLIPVRTCCAHETWALGLGEGVALGGAGVGAGLGAALGLGVGLGNAPALVMTGLPQATSRMASATVRAIRRCTAGMALDCPVT
jgi:hypothetical protein